MVSFMVINTDTEESTPVYIPPLTYIENNKIIQNPKEFSG